MADQARDPIAAARLDRIEAELLGLREEFAQTSARLEQSAAETRAAAREGGAAPVSRGGRGAASAEPGAIEKATANMDELAVAEERAAAAAEQRLGIQIREAQAIRSSAAGIGRSELLDLPGRGGGPGAAPGVVPPVPVKTTQLSEISDLSKRQQALVESARQIPPAERAISTEMEYQARVMSLSSLQYQRHGALTTEFIAAAAKGQTTIRELGDQILLTIGKFAGWTAAAGAVYGALGAVTALGRGAVESASGVDQLSRFIDNINADKAAQQFRNLSAANNVSIKDASDAQAAFAKVFQNQDQAYGAADVALKATQLDQISLADSTRYLTGAIVGFRLPFSQLPQVFDQVSAGQRRMGASVAQTLAALGGSSAAVRNAGGDWDQYVALVTAAQRATAQTGSVIGTAFRRSASTFVTKPQNIAILKSFGLDPTESYTQLLIDAVQKAKGLSGRQINELAVGLGGPQQGARVFAGLLSRPDLVEKALDITSPAKASGSAAAELKDRLKQADQVIKSVGFSLERLGSALAQSGALTPFVGLLEGFGKVADLVTHLLDLIDKLPGGLGKVLVPLAEIYGVFRLLGNRDLGNLVPVRYALNRPGGIADTLRGTDQAPGVLRPSVNRAAQKDIEKGLDEQKAAYQDMAATASRNASRLAVQVEAQKQEVAALVASNAEGETIAAEMERLVALQRQASRVVREELFLRQGVTELDAQRNVYLAGIRQGLRADAAAAQAGIRYRPGTLERPGGGGAAPVPVSGLSPGGVILPAGVSGEPAAAATQLEEAQSGLRGRLTEMNASLAATGRGGQLLSRAFSTAGGAALSTAAIARGTAVSAAGLLSAGIDPLLAAMLGLPAAFELISAGIKDFSNEFDLIIHAANQTGQTADQLDQSAAQLKHHTKLSRLNDFITHNFLDQPVIAPLAQAAGIGLTTPDDEADQIAKLEQARARQLRFQQARGRGVPESRIESQVARQYADAQDQRQAAQAIAGGWAQVANDFERLYGTSEQGRQSVEKYKQFVLLLIAQASANGKDLRQVVNSISDPATLTQFINQNQARFDIQGPTSKLGFEGAAAAQARAAQLLSQTPASSKDFAKYLEAYKKAAEQITTNANQAQQDALTLAGTNPVLQQRARSDYLDRIGQSVVQTRRDLQDALRTYDAHKKGIRDLSAHINELQAQAEGALGPLGGAIEGVALVPDKSKLEKLIQRARRDKEAVKILKQFLAQLEEQTKVAREQAAEANLTATVSENDAHTSYLASLSRDPSAQARIQLQGAYRDLASLNRSGVNDPVQRWRDMQQIQTYEQQAIDADLTKYEDALNLAEARSDIGASQGARLQNAVQKWAQLAAHLRSLGSRVDPSKLNAVLISQAQAQDAVIQYNRQQAVDNINASFALLEAQANGNPFTIDRLEQEKLRRLLAQPGLTHADRVNYQAQLLAAGQKSVDDRASAREEDIQFQLSIGTISLGQAELDVQNLLKVRNLSYQRRRELQHLLQTFQHQTQQEASGFDLNVGNIKLPTAYDVRRALVAATQAGHTADNRVIVTNNNNISITATNKEGEHAVYDGIDKLLKTGVKQAVRAAGHRR